MLKTQVKIQGAWLDARQRAAEAAADETGEVTAQTAIIVVLVTAAIAAGAVIATAMANNASSIPSP